LVKRFLIAAGVLLLSCCSSSSSGSSGSEQDDAGSRGSDGGRGDDALIVPEGLGVTALAGGSGVLEVTALTLRDGANGIELYAALRNDGDVPACHAALSVELFDASDQSLAAGIGGLLTQRFYRLTDGSDSIAACVGPGDVTMTAVADLPADLATEDVKHVVYRCPYFALEVVPIAGLTVRQVKRVRRSGGTEAYVGTMVNELDVAVSNPSVTVFPVNRVGRPLGMAATGSDSDSGMVELASGGSWMFETNTVSEPGVDQVAFPAASVAR
jgi:hypothetical protein